MIKKILFISIIIFSSGCSSSENLEVEDYFNLVKSKGYSVGEKENKIYQLLMATDGYGMEVDGETIEVYEFDLSSKSGKNTLSKLENDGFMGVGLIVNKNLALIKYTEHPKWKELKELFLSL